MIVQIKNPNRNPKEKLIKRRNVYLNVSLANLRRLAIDSRELGCAIVARDLRHK